MDLGQAAQWLDGNVPNITNTNSTASMYQLSTDSEFHFVLTTILANSNGQGAATGEVLRLANQIEPGNFTSWYNEFKYMADQIHSLAQSADAARFPVSAREAYFRSAAYYRFAPFFLRRNWTDERMFTAWDSQLADFEKAIKLLPEPAERITLNTTHNFTVPAYFFPAPQDHARCGCPERKPTVIACTGYDGAQEDLYHTIGKEILARGYNFVSYEGPGQATVRLQQNIGFIPEWWEAVSPVIDYLATRDDVDMSRLVHQGISYGGLLAPLAATVEHRFAAVIAIDGLVNVHQVFEEQFPPELMDLFTSGNRTAFNDAIDAAYNTASTAFKWAVDQGMWAFDEPDPFDWFTKIGTIFLDEQKMQQIQCPVFVGSGQDDDLGGKGQPEEAARLLGNKAYYHLFLTDVGAGEHCAIGAEAQLSMATLDWLAGVFDGMTGTFNSTTSS